MSTSATPADRVFLDGFSLYTDHAGFSRKTVDGPTRPMHLENTAYCGVYSAETEVPDPNPQEKPGCEYRCPRCRRQYSRRYTIKQHFPHCIRRHGNPLALRWQDGLFPGKQSYHIRRPNRRWPYGPPGAEKVKNSRNNEQLAYEAYQHL